jgi:hydroxymethylglutaryl-CoA synthase
MRLMEIDSGTTIGKDSPEAKSAAADFANRVAPALDLNARVGNIYTGALFLSLAYLLETSGERLAGKQISLFSYGSGCGAEFMGATIAQGAASLMKKESYLDILNRRKHISVKQYEEMLDACGKMDINGESVCDPQRWGLSRSVLYLGTKGHKRVYTVNGKILV